MGNFAEKCIAFFKKEIVLCIAVVLAVLSCVIVPPSAAYISYIDWDTLALLFSLMAVMKGLQQANFFVFMANLFLKRIKSTRTMLFILVFLPFLFSMVITNDVSLIAFVPFGLTLLHLSGQEKYMVPQVVLQTIAANLGSMLTPMGNPQNLYLYNKSGMDFGAFCGLLLPYVVASGVGLAVVILLLKPAPLTGLSLSAPLGNPRSLLFCAGGFLLCLLGVFKVLSPLVIAAIVLVALAFRGRHLLVSIDYSLLGTFFAFFIFVGNVARIHQVQSFLVSVLEGRIEIVSILVSQVISNVPAALLLSGFTSHWEGLIIGCNFGGLGTLIASMASLISYKLVVKDSPAQGKGYFRWFTLLNIAFLVFLYLLYLLIG